MHLPLARLVSMPVIFCLLPSSSILHFTYFLHASVNSMCENCECKTVNTVHWFDASCSDIPVNNSITVISPVQFLAGLQVQFLAGLHFLPLTVLYAYSSANFRTVFSESQNASPLDAELGPDFNAK